MALDQAGYRWRLDDGDEDGATWMEAQNTNIQRWRNSNVRLRMLIDATGNPDAAQFRLEYRKKGTTQWYVAGTGEPSDLPSASPSASQSISPSSSVSPSISSSASTSISLSKSASVSSSKSKSKSKSLSKSRSKSLSHTPSHTPSPSPSPSASPSGDAFWDGVTVVHQLSCDDNAASSAIDNAGTGLDWICRDGNNDPSYTTNIHSATVKEGTGSFLIGQIVYDEGTNYITSTDNWTAERFKAEFWYNPTATNVASPNYEMVFYVGTNPGTDPANSFALWRGNDYTSPREILAVAYGNSGAAQTKMTSDLTPTGGTWVKLRIQVDATATPWTVNIWKSANGTDWTAVSWGAWSGNPVGDTAFNAPVCLGYNVNAGPEVADYELIDDFKMGSY